MTTERTETRLIREGNHIVEVEITLIETDHEWSPYVSAADVRKLDEARLALRRGDLKAAAQFGRVYEMTPAGMAAE